MEGMRIIVTKVKFAVSLSSELHGVLQARQGGASSSGLC